MTQHNKIEGAMALQDAWPDATCYGCGPANPAGHRIKSY